MVKTEKKGLGVHGKIYDGGDQTFSSDKIISRDEPKHANHASGIDKGDAENTSRLENSSLTSCPVQVPCMLYTPMTMSR